MVGKRGRKRGIKALCNPLTHSNPAHLPKCKLLKARKSNSSSSSSSRSNNSRVVAVRARVARADPIEVPLFAIVVADLIFLQSAQNLWK